MADQTLVINEISKKKFVKYLQQRAEIIEENGYGSKITFHFEPPISYNKLRKLYVIFFTSR